MSRIPVVMLITLLYSSISMAAGTDVAFDKSHYIPVTYHVDGFDGTEPNAWAGLFAEYKNEYTTTEEVIAEDSLERRQSALGTGIGLEVAPLFGTYGVFRTSFKSDKSTYLAIGVAAEELFMDETDNIYSRNDSEFSYGFGVKNSSYNIEYMLYMDEENYGVAAFSFGFISEF